jgi:hypothetical protein
MTRHSKFDASIDKRRALNDAENSGIVADSLDVRMALIKRMEAGEMTLAQVQEELKKIKRNAKKNGHLTRSQVWSRA